MMEIEKMNLDIVILTETKKKGIGQETYGNYIHLWSGVPKSEQGKSGVSILVKKKWTRMIQTWEEINHRILKIRIKIHEQMLTIIGVYAINDNVRAEEKEEFFNILDEQIESVSKQSELIIIGDLNSRVGKKDNDHTLGKYGEETVNDNGRRLLTLCREHRLMIGNTFFQHKDIHKYTWIQPTRGLRSIIDLVIVRRDRKLKIKDIKVFRQPECGSNHHMVVGTFECTRKTTHTKRNEDTEEQMEELKYPKYKIELLREESIKKLYQNRLEMQLDGNIVERSPEEIYEHLKSSIHIAANEALGIEQRSKYKKETFSAELEEKIKIKKERYNEWLKDKTQNSRQKYVEYRRQVKEQVKKEKNDYWDNVCRNINNTIGFNRSKEAWRVIRNLRQETKNTTNITLIKPKQWIEHYETLLQEKRPQYMIKHDGNERNKISVEEREIRKEDVIKALRQSKNNKSAGPGNIRIELVKYGGNKLIEIVTKMFQKIEGGENIPTEWNKSYIVSIHKKGSKTVCQNYRGISILPTMVRLLGRIIKTKIENHMEDFSEEQGGFRSGRSCIDNIHCIRQVIEKNQAKNIDTHITFVDLEKAYDNVPRCQLWEAMRRMRIKEKWIEVTKALYENSEAQIRVGNKVTKAIEVSKGLKQGCTLSPIMFNIYAEQALEKWYRKCGGMGIPIRDKTLHSLMFADDQLIVAQDEEDMIYMLRKLKEEYDKWGLLINFKKTEYMCVGRLAQNLHIGHETIKACTEYKYLGSIISDTGKIEKDIEDKVIKGKRATKALHGTIWNRNLTKQTKKNIFNAIVEPITTYGGELWPMTNKIRDKIRTVELDFMRRSLQYTRMDRIRTEDIWREMEVEISITRRLENKTLRWYGHVQRMNEERWPRAIMNWSPRGKRKRGRPTVKWKTCVYNSMLEKDLREEDIEDRDYWRLRTANL